VASDIQSPDKRSTSSHSEQLYARARRVLPGGNSRDTIFYSPHPLYADFGQGCRVTDVDGVERIDFVNNYSSLIHGHGNPGIDIAVRRQFDRVAAVGMPTEQEILLAELLCERIPSVERIRFTNSGTEAIMMALRAARYFTGRGTIAKVEGAYHGSYLPLETASGPQRGEAGRSPENIVLISYNDVEGARRILEANADALACVLIDPLMSRLAYTPASVEFMEMLRETTRRIGALLVFDEIYSFRVAPGGVQQKRGVTPDLTTLGKIIGGSFPIGAVGGRAEIMTVFDPSKGGDRLPHGGTYNANPISMAAGYAGMLQMTDDAYAHLDQLGDQARMGLQEILQEADADAQVIGEGSLLAIAPTRKPISSWRDFAACEARSVSIAAFHRYMLDNGILMATHGTFVLSTPMSANEIDALLETARKGVRLL